MSNHTPGPWVVQEPDPENKGSGLLVKPVPGQVVAEVDRGPEMVGNAHLIAAAPDLLAALREIYAEVTEDTAGLTRNDYESIVLTIRDVAGAAIAKAEGRGS